MNSIHRLLPTLLIGAALTISLTGCGKSKEQEAVERMNRPGPGRVRVVNMTTDSVGLAWTSMVLEVAIKPDTIGGFRSVGSGDQKVRILFNGNDALEVPLKVEEKKLYSIVVFGSGGSYKASVIEGLEQMYPNSTKNLQAFFIDDSGKPFSGKVDVTNGTDKYTFDDKTGGVLATTGDYKVEGEGLASTVGSKIEADAAYSLLVIKDPAGKTHARLVRNTSAEKPIAGGTQ